MNLNKKSAFASLLVVVLLFGIVLVPLAGAAREDKTPEKESKEEKGVKVSWAEWEQAHTVDVDVTTVYNYKKDGNFEITETYSGDELEKKCKVNKLTKTKSFTVPSGKKVTVNTPAGSIEMKPGGRKEVLSEKSVVLTTADDPFEWWLATDEPDEPPYPQWTWSKIWLFYELEDPINLVWEQSSLKTVKRVVLKERWVDNPSEYTHYIQFPDGSWVKGDGVADSKYRVLGGYHARLWEVPDGAVIASAHHDDDIFIIPGHQVDEYEAAEEKVAGFFGSWYVFKDCIYLANPVGNPGDEPYNEGNATLITK